MIRDANPPRLPLTIIAHAASFIPFPRNASCLSVCIELRRLIRRGSFQALELGIDLIEPSLPSSAVRRTQTIYCGGTSHPLVECDSIQMLEIDGEAHAPHTCPYLEQCNFNSLVLHNVAHPVSELRQTLAAVGQRSPQQIIIKLQRFSRFTGQLGPMLDRSQVEFQPHVPQGVRFWPGEPGVEQYMLDCFLRAVEKAFRCVVILGDVSRMNVDDGEEWPKTEPGLEPNSVTDDCGGW